MKLPQITLEQWYALVAVADLGTVAAAAEALNKSQSTVSYALSRLNKALPSPAFEAQGRGLKLTALGELLLKRARRLINDAEDTERLAAQFITAGSLELVVAVDAVFPYSLLLATLSRFAKQYPNLRVKLLETSLSGTDEALLERKADVALLARVPPGFTYTRITDMQFVAVAAREHPLAQLDRQIEDDDLRRHRQFVLRDSGVKRNQDAGWLGADVRWTVSHFDTSVRCVLQGLGYAWLPYDRVCELLEQGRLVRLDLVEGAVRDIPLYFVARQGDVPQQLVQSLRDLLKQQNQDLQLSGRHW